MAFGITKEELAAWKRRVAEGKIAFLTHYWLHPRYPGITSVTKVGCSDLQRLREWAIAHGLPPQYIHQRDVYPHYDLFGDIQADILRREGQWEQLRKFVSPPSTAATPGTASASSPQRSK